MCHEHFPHIYVLRDLPKPWKVKCHYATLSPTKAVPKAGGAGGCHRSHSFKHPCDHFLSFVEWTIQAVPSGTRLEHSCLCRTTQEWLHCTFFLVLARPGALPPREELCLSLPFSAEHPTVPRCCNRWDHPVVSSRKVLGTKGETWGEIQTLNISFVQETKDVVNKCKGFLGSAGGFSSPWLCAHHSSSPPASAPEEIRATYSLILTSAILPEHQGARERSLWQCSYSEIIHRNQNGFIKSIFLGGFPTFCWICWADESCSLPEMFIKNLMDNFVLWGQGFKF